MWLVCTINNQDLIIDTKESIALTHKTRHSEHTSLGWEVSSSLRGRQDVGKRKTDKHVVFRLQAEAPLSSSS